MHNAINRESSFQVFCFISVESPNTNQPGYHEHGCYTYFFQGKEVRKVKYEKLYWVEDN